MSDQCDHRWETEETRRLGDSEVIVQTCQSCGQMREVSRAKVRERSIPYGDGPI